MKAALLTAPKTFEIQTVPEPVLKPGYVLVRVNRVGVCGSDIHFYEAGRIGETALTEPFLMGHEFSGIIEDTHGVSESPPVGTRVAVDPAIHCGTCIYCKMGRPNICPNVQFTGFPPYPGALADLIAAPVHNIYPIPDSITDDEGPLLETLAVAIHAAELAGDLKNKTCAVIGAGPVGLLTMLVLRHYGAHVVLVTEPVQERREFAQSLGFYHSFHPDDEKSIYDQLKTSTDEGLEWVFETAGEPESYQMALEMVRPGGAVYIIGIYPHGSMPIDFTSTRRKETTIQFVRRSLPRNYPEAIRLASEKLVHLQPLATHVFPLKQTADAYRIAHQKEDGAIKVLIQPSQSNK